MAPCLSLGFIGSCPRHPPSGSPDQALPLALAEALGAAGTGWRGLTAASLSKRAKSSLRVMTSSWAVHWDARLVKPSMSANRMLGRQAEEDPSEAGRAGGRGQGHPRPQASTILGAPWLLGREPTEARPGDPSMWSLPAAQEAAAVLSGFQLLPGRKRGPEGCVSRSLPRTQAPILITSWACPCWTRSHPSRWLGLGWGSGPNGGLTRPHFMHRGLQPGALRPKETL